jgi:hypothetical protein
MNGLNEHEDRTKATKHDIQISLCILKEITAMELDLFRTILSHITEMSSTESASAQTVSMEAEHLDCYQSVLLLLLHRVSLLCKANRLIDDKLDFSATTFVHVLPFLITTLYKVKLDVVVKTRICSVMLDFYLQAYGMSELIDVVENLGMLVTIVRRHLEVANHSFETDSTVVVENLVALINSIVADVTIQGSQQPEDIQILVEPIGKMSVQWLKHLTTSDTGPAPMRLEVLCRIVQNLLKMPSTSFDPCAKTESGLERCWLLDFVPLLLTLISQSIKHLLLVPILCSTITTCCLHCHAIGMASPIDQFLFFPEDSDERINSGFSWQIVFKALLVTHRQSPAVVLSISEFLATVMDLYCNVGSVANATIAFNKCLEKSLDVAQCRCCDW